MVLFPLLFICRILVQCGSNLGVCLCGFLIFCAQVLHDKLSSQQKSLAELQSRLAHAEHQPKVSDKSEELKHAQQELVGISVGSVLRTVFPLFCRLSRASSVYVRQTNLLLNKTFALITLHFKFQMLVLTKTNGVLCFRPFVLKSGMITTY